MVGRIRDPTTGKVQSSGGKKDNRNEDRDANPMNDSIPGEVVRRRQHKEERSGPSEKALADTDLQTILAKGSGTREKWLKKALQQVQDGDLPAQEVYNILRAPDFAADLKEKTGRSMFRYLCSKITVFSKGQQRFLTSQSSFAQMFGADGTGARPAEDVGAAGSGEAVDDMMARVRAFVDAKNTADLATADPPEPQVAAEVPSPAAFAQVPSPDAFAQVPAAIDPSLSKAPSPAPFSLVPAAMALFPHNVVPVATPQAPLAASSFLDVPLASPPPPVRRQDNSAVAMFAARAAASASRFAASALLVEPSPAPKLSLEAETEAKPELGKESGDEKEQSKNESGNKKQSRSASPSNSKLRAKKNKRKQQSSSSRSRQRSPSKPRRRSSRSRSRDRRRR